MKKSILTTVALTAAVTLSGCAGASPDNEEVTVLPEEVTDGSQSEADITEESSAAVQSDGQSDAEQTKNQSGEQNTTQEREDEPETQIEEKIEEEEPEEEQVEEQTPTVAVVTYAKYIKVTGTGVNIRSGAGTGYSSVGTAEKDTLYACLGESGGWYKTQYKGQTVYISSKYCDEVEIEASGSGDVESVIREGLKLLGVEYVYGAVRCHDGTGRLNSGFTTSAFDCSSLTQYVFYKGAGVLLQVNTRTQIYQGGHVELSDLQRGDLMFFTNDSRCNNTGIERVGHVAIYLGDNYILHTASDYAKIEQLTTKRWNYFIEARRMV